MGKQVKGQSQEALRLEELWRGEFGDAYVERNRRAADVRERFWKKTISDLKISNVLEVGCNTGANLKWIAECLPSHQVYGIDINLKALRELRGTVPDGNVLWSMARDLPFRDRLFDLVFTFGVLIHQPESTLPLVMSEIVRCSRRYVLCGEYFASKTTEVFYRGHKGALFKRDYAGIYKELFPELKLIKKGFLSRAKGWDDITYWIFEKDPKIR